MVESIPQMKQRKNYYIDKKFQNSFIIRFCSLVAGGALLTAILLYALSYNSTSVSIVKSRVEVMTTANYMLPLLIQTLTVVTVAVSLLVIIVMVFVSHKIAGPLFRFRQAFKELSQGDFSNQVKLRKDDQLLETVVEFNQMISAVRAQILVLQKELTAVKEDVRAMDDPQNDENKRRQFQNLNFMIKKLEKTINFFRV